MFHTRCLRVFKVNRGYETRDVCVCVCGRERERVSERKRGVKGGKQEKEVIVRQRRRHPEKERV